MKKTIDKILKDHGVDWKLNDEEYYQSLLNELVSKVEERLK